MVSGFNIRVAQLPRENLIYRSRSTEGDLFARHRPRSYLNRTGTGTQSTAESYRF